MLNGGSLNATKFALLIGASVQFRKVVFPVTFCMCFVYSVIERFFPIFLQRFDLWLI